MREPAPPFAACLIVLFARAAAGEQPNTSTTQEPRTDQPAEVTAPTSEGKDEPVPVDEEEEALPPPVPSATDTLSGHLAVSGAAILSEPFGQLQDGIDQAEVLSTGFGAALELAYGVSRTVVIGAWGQALWIGAGESCSDCSAASYAFGPFVRYHLVQGVRFDPWMSAGFGLRLTGIDAGGDSLSYTGWDLLSLEVGGDWYAWKQLGFGPFMAFDMGLYTNRPEDLTALGYGADRGEALYYFFGIGARVTLDLPGK